MRKPFLTGRSARRLSALGVLAVFLVVVHSMRAVAVDVFWNVAGPADWNTPGNWSPGRVPTGTDNATFNNGGVATISGDTPTFADVRFGDGANNGGTVNQSAGTVNGIWLRMNMSGNAVSAYNLSGGSATFTRINVNEAVGTRSSGLTVQGGTLTVPQASGPAGQGLGAVFIGGSNLATSFLNVDSTGNLVVGADTTDNESIVVGGNGTASSGTSVSQFGVFGGTVTVQGAGNMIVGSTNPGNVIQSGGAVNLFTASGANSWLHVGDGANGTYSLSGGTLTLTNPSNDLVLGNVGSGEFDLDGGTATLGPIYGFGSSSVFNFNGGTLRPNASQASMNQTAFMFNLTTANVRNGGAIIDTNGFNVTIAQPLVRSTISGDNAIDGGLIKLGAGELALSSPASTYNGSTSVLGGTLLVPTSGSNPFGSGYFTNGATYTISGAGSTLGTLGTGPMHIEATTMNVTSGGTLAPSGDLNIGEVFAGTLVVDGTGSSAALAPNTNFTLGSSGFFSSSGALTVSNNATFTVGTGGTSNILNGTININGGSVDLKSLNYSSGTINFTSGALNFLGNLEVGPNGLLGPNLTLNGTQRLTLNGATLVDNGSVLTLDGGTLSTGGLTVFNGGAFNFIAGTLTITSPGATVAYPIVTNSTSTININADNVSLGDGSLTGFNHGGVLNVNGPYTLTLNSASYARLGVLTALGGGKINAPNGVTLAAGSNLVGPGSVNGRVTGEAGSLIQANGNLTLGDAASPAGYDFGGELRIGVGTVTIKSSATAGLGNLTTLGTGVLSGTLNVANGYLLDFDQAMTGFGLVNSTDNILQRAIINGSVQGMSMAQPITLSGWIKGTGTFTNVVFSGTHDPGFSPTLLQVGNVAYASTATLIIELGGTSRGSQYDSIDASGNMSLAGTLELVTLNGFVPAAGDKFVVMTYPSMTGTFSSVTGTSPAPGLTYETVYMPTSLVILTTTNGEKTWGVDSDGNSSLGSNWIGGIAPAGVGDSATFSTIITAPRTVTLDADTILGSLNFDSPISYTIAGTHVLTLQAAGSAAATISVSGAHGNGSHTISAPISLESDLNITQNSGGTLRLTGPLNDAAGHSITTSGSGVTEIDGLPNFGAHTSLVVNSGTLRFALTGGSPTIGAGVKATVSSGATLELAGSVSALSNGANRVNVINNSNAPGILVSGTHQQVGNIDGTGTTQVNAGSDLTANHIIQAALLIGGTSKNPGLVTIDASDVSGNPLGQTDGFALAGSLTPSGPIGAGGTSSVSLSSGAGGGTDLAALSLGSSPGGGNPSSVPEPSTLLLALLAVLGVVSTHFVRHHFRCQAI